MPISGIALFLLLAQNATPQQPALPVAPASIEGVVAKALTGESLSKATVTLTEVRSPAAPAADLQSNAITPNSREYELLLASLNQRNTGPPKVMTTASDGRFLFENLTPGTYSLKATAGGYAPAEYGQRGPNSRGTTITLKAGQKMQGVSLTMTPGGAITGHIVDANGEPLSRAMVQAQKLIYQERGRSLVTVEAVPTDDRGEYRLYWLPPGKYYISAIPFDDRARSMTAMVPTASDANATMVALTAANVYGAVRDMGTGPIDGIAGGTKVTARTLASGEVIEEAAVQVFYPAALDVAAATAIEIRPGVLTSGIDITTRPARVYRIRSRVISSVTGQPISASDISLLPGNNTAVSPPVRIPPAPNSSSYELAGVLPGSYYFVAAGTDGAGQPLLGISSIEVQEANLENVVVTATPPFVIQGRVLAGNTISNATNPPIYIVRLEPLLPGPLTGSSMRARQDNFILPIPVPGDYRVSVTTPPNTYVQSIRFGGQDVLRDGLHLDGPTSETLEVVVRPNAGRLEGNVSLDRQKFSNATVVLAPASALRQQTNLYQTVQSNAEGHFLFENIAPGSYKAFAWEDVEALAWFDAEFMRNFENRGTEILIREGAKESIEMTVIPR